MSLFKIPHIGGRVFGLTLTVLAHKMSYLNNLIPPKLKMKRQPVNEIDVNYSFRANQTR